MWPLAASSESTMWSRSFQSQDSLWPRTRSKPSTTRSKRDPSPQSPVRRIKKRAFRNGISFYDEIWYLLSLRIIECPFRGKKGEHIKERKEVHSAVALGLTLPPFLSISWKGKRERGEIQSLLRKFFFLPHSLLPFLKIIRELAFGKIPRCSKSSFTRRSDFFPARALKRWRYQFSSLLLIQNN